MPLNEGPELDPKMSYRAVIETNHGTLTIKLFAKEAPVTVRNFVNLAEGTREFRDAKSGNVEKRPYYDGVIFHRCISGFMVQGGDPTGTGRGGPGYNFKDEFAPSLRFNKGGLLAMANAGPGTNGSQFFITEGPTPHLNDRHTIFGELENPADLELVKKMSRLPQNAANRPNDDVKMLAVRIVRKPLGALMGG